MTLYYTERLCVIEMCGVQLGYTALLQCCDDSRADVLVHCTAAVCYYSVVMTAGQMC